MDLTFQAAKSASFWLHMSKKRFTYNSVTVTKMNNFIREAHNEDSF